MFIAIDQERPAEGPPACGGGVAANRKLRANLTEACAARGIDLVVAPPDWCTDNAAMGAVAIERWKHGRYDDLDLDVIAGLIRPDVPQRA